jgi:hypothetical protein
LCIAQADAVSVRRPDYELWRGQKPCTLTEEMFIKRLEILYLETEMDGVDLMMSEGISGWTHRVNVINQFKLMFTPVIAKEDKLTAHSIYAGMVTPWRCRHFCLSYHLEADHFTVESDLFIQISNDQTRVL